MIWYSQKPSSHKKQYPLKNVLSKNLNPSNPYDARIPYNPPANCCRTPKTVFRHKKRFFGLNLPVDTTNKSIPRWKANLSERRSER